MVEFTLATAGCAVAVQALYESTKAYCAGYWTDAAPTFSVVIRQADIDFEREKLPEGESYTDPALEVIALQRKIAEQLFDYDILLFHGSAVAVDGAAYLFTAKSGTGKSTHARLWREMLGQRAQMVNDDKPFLRFTADGVLVCGSPWNGKHRLGNQSQVPLRAVCVLQRGEENKICPITPKDALLTLLQQSNRPMDCTKMGHYLELIDRLCTNVSFYRLQCNMDPEAAAVAYNGMRP